MEPEGKRQKRMVPGHWTGYRAEYPCTKGIHELFEEHARVNPRSIALITDESQITYEELNARANQLAAHLRSAAVGPDVTVGICLERGPEMVVGMLSILKAGGAYVPLDPRYPADRLAFMVADTSVATILTDRASITSLPQASASNALMLDQGCRSIARLPAVECVSGAGPRNLAYVMYTSGSTGRPKGVMVEHRSVVRLVRNNKFADFASSQRFAQLSPMSFDASVFEIWGPLLNGASLVIMPAGVPALDVIVGVIKRHRVTTAFFTPALFNILVDYHASELQTLRQVVIGGDVVSPRHIRAAMEQMPECKFINGYGPTESTVFAVCHTINGADTKQQIPIGRPIANTEVFILDDDLQPVGMNEPGELYIGGDGLARGYLRRPELTAEKFIVAPWSGERLYRTGDLGRWRDDGVVEFMGRIDGQVKVSGYRIEPGEIECTLREHSVVRDALVVCEQHGPADKRLIAYVTGDRMLIGKELELRRFLAGRLPQYMVPEAIVVLEQFPLTPNGKVDRAALPGVPAAAAPASNGAAAGCQDKGGVEKIIAGVWSSVLRRSQVAVDQNFFEAGGDSLKLIEVHAAVRRTVAPNLSIPDLFEHPTIASLARFINNQIQNNYAKPELEGRARKRQEMLRRLHVSRETL